MILRLVLCNLLRLEGEMKRGGGFIGFVSFLFSFFSFSSFSFSFSFSISFFFFLFSFFFFLLNPFNPQTYIRKLKEQ